MVQVVNPAPVDSVSAADATDGASAITRTYAGEMGRRLTPTGLDAAQAVLWLERVAA